MIVAYRKPYNLLRQISPSPSGGGFFCVPTPAQQHTALSTLEYALSACAGGQERFSIAIALQRKGYALSTALNTHFYSYCIVILLVTTYNANKGEAMLKVTAGSVKVLKSGRKKFHDQYLIDCVKAVTNKTDVMVTECQIPNTLNDKARIRNRIAKTQGATKVLVKFYLFNDKLTPVLTKRHTKVASKK